MIEPLINKDVMMNILIHALLLGILSMLFCLPVLAYLSHRPAQEPVTISFYKRGYAEGGTDITSVTNAKAVEAFEKTKP